MHDVLGWIGGWQYLEGCNLVSQELGNWEGAERWGA